MELKNEVVSFEKVPTLVSVREELSKSRHRYLTFLCEEGCDILKQYLERRISDGESLSSESGIITTSLSSIPVIGKVSEKIAKWRKPKHVIALYDLKRAISREPK